MGGAGIGSHRFGSAAEGEVCRRVKRGIGCKIVAVRTVHLTVIIHGGVMTGNGNSRINLIDGNNRTALHRGMLIHGYFIIYIISTRIGITRVFGERILALFGAVLHGRTGGYAHGNAVRCTVIITRIAACADIGYRRIFERHFPVF